MAAWHKWLFFKALWVSKHNGEEVNRHLFGILDFYTIDFYFLEQL